MNLLDASSTLPLSIIIMKPQLTTREFSAPYSWDVKWVLIEVEKS